MTVEIKAPAFPESVADGVVSAWHKGPGDSVARDELLVEIETDKVVMEVVAPEPGVIEAIMVAEGETITSEAVLATLAAGAVSTPTPSAKTSGSTEDAPDAASGTAESIPMGPAVRALLDEHGLSPEGIAATGKGGRLLKEDVLSHLKQTPEQPAPQPSAPSSPAASPAAVDLNVDGPTSERIEKRVPMTRMRARIAERLLGATQQTAMLTTFNEVNMAPLMKLRRQYRDEFESVHNGTRLGFMGFFVKAACEALKRFPEVNASIDGDDIVYHGYFDVGVAVSSDRGLVVPVLRVADAMSLASVESKIREFGAKAMDGKLSMDEMTGGTFTITNGGVFGSLMSTPILNPPQAAILGMHKIQERPMAVNGEVKILPMMNLALSYDHRLIDGKDAVQFLVAIKEMIEDPARILLEL